MAQVVALHAFDGAHTFALTVAARQLLGFVVDGLEVIRGRSARIGSSPTYVKQTLRLALSITGSTTTFKALYALLQKSKSAWVRRNAAAIAGAACSAWLWCLDASSRHVVLLYLGVRALQAACRERKTKWKKIARQIPAGKQMVKLLESQGDTLMFAVTSAVVMYCYVMRHDALPPSYLKFIVTTGPIPPVVLKGTQDCANNRPVNVMSLVQHWQQHVRRGVVPPEWFNPYPTIMGCDRLHPHTDSCISAVLRYTWLPAFRRTFLLYTTVNAIPMLSTIHRVLRQPLKSLIHLVVGTFRSTSFLSSFVAIYLAVICTHRKFATTESKFMFFVAGLVAGLSVLIEKKGRRFELAMYVLPRALDALATIFVPFRLRQRLRTPVHGVLLALTVGVLLQSYARNPSNVPSLLHKPIQAMFFNLYGSHKRAALGDQNQGLGEAKQPTQNTQK